MKLSVNSTVSIAAASFSIYAYEALKDELENVDELRFIFTSPTFIKDKAKKEKREFFIPKLNRERNLYGSDFEVKLRNKLEQKAIAKECAEWIRRKVKFKSNASQEEMGGFLHVQNQKPSAYVPFNEFTTTELGCERGNAIYSMVNVMPSPFAEEYLKIFNEQWQNSDKFKDVTARAMWCSFWNMRTDTRYCSIIKNRRQTESRQARLNGRGAKEEGEANGKTGRTDSSKLSRPLPRNG